MKFGKKLSKIYTHSFEAEIMLMHIYTIHITIWISIFKNYRKMPLKVWGGDGSGDSFPDYRAKR